MVSDVPSGSAGMKVMLEGLWIARTAPLRRLYISGAGTYQKPAVLGYGLATGRGSYRVRRYRQSVSRFSRCSEESLLYLKTFSAFGINMHTGIAPNDAETSAVSRDRSLGHQASAVPECRICLQSGSQPPGEALIEEFCACSGTVRFAHETCIIAWAKEKWSLRWVSRQ